MIDRAIGQHIGERLDEGRRVNRTVQQVARLIGIPAFALMLVGLAVQAIGPQAAKEGYFPGQQVVAFTHLFRVSEFSANSLMSIGLLGLCLVPVMSILVILAHHLRARRWIEAAVSLLVVGILLLSVLIGNG